MRPAPPLAEWRRHPVISATAFLAAATTLAWWAGADVSFMLQTPELRNGQLWRLLTGCLLHGNVLHLVFNLYWLWVFGTLVESRLGPLRTAAILLYLAAGSAAAEYAVLEGGVGLSGVVYGLFGMLWVLGRRDWRFAGAVDQNTVVLFVVWFFLCIGMTLSGTLPIANIAHGAGAVLGAGVGLGLCRGAGGRRLVFVGLAIVLAAGLFFSTRGRRYVNLSSSGDEPALVGYEALVGKDWAQAERWFSIAVRRNPAHPGYWFNLAIALDAQGRHNEALAAYERAYQRTNDREIRAGFEMALEAAAGRALADGRTEKAEQLYERLVELHPQEPRFWFALGAARLRLGREAEAAAAFAQGQRQGAERGPQTRPSPP